MPSTRVTVKIRSNVIAATRNKILASVKGVIDESAQNIEDFAKAIAPVDTGALQSSIYKNNGETTDYDTNVAVARSRNKDANFLDIVDPEFVISLSGSNDDTYTQVVGVAAEYGLFVEHGTRHMHAQPFLLPAALGEESTFANNMGKVAG